MTACRYIEKIVGALISHVPSCAILSLLGERMRARENVAPFFPLIISIFGNSICLGDFNFRTRISRATLQITMEHVAPVLEII